MSNTCLSSGINLIRDPVEDLEALVFDTQVIHNQIEKNTFGTHSGTCFLWTLRRTHDFYFRLLTAVEFQNGDDFLEKCTKPVVRLIAIPLGIVLKISTAALWAITMTAASLERFIIKAQDDKEIKLRQSAFENVIRKDDVIIMGDLRGRLNMAAAAQRIRNELANRQGGEGFDFGSPNFDKEFRLDLNLPGEKLY